jgi:hypothetical protein
VRDSAVVRGKEVIVLAGALVLLVAILLFSPTGLVGFMQSVEETNLISVSILASLIGIVFVLLHKFGFTFGSVEEIGPRQ